MTAFKIHRAADYTPEMHQATDRYEAAANGLAKADTADDYAEWSTEIQRAKKLYGHECLKMERKRRPDHGGRCGA